MKKSHRKLHLLFMLVWNVLLEKMHSCQNNFEKFYEEKKSKHTSSGYSIFTGCSFDPTKNKLDFYKDEHCMKSFCKGLREHSIKIMNYEKKKRDDTTNL